MKCKKKTKKKINPCNNTHKIPISRSNGYIDQSSSKVRWFLFKFKFMFLIIFICCLCMSLFALLYL